MRVGLFYQKTFNLLPSSSGWKRYTVNGRLLSALPFEIRPKTKTFQLTKSLPPKFKTNHASGLQLKLKRWLHIKQITAAETVTSLGQRIHSTIKKSTRKIIVGRNTPKNALQDLITKTLPIRHLSIKILRMMREF